jgi:hypothetical protein
MNRSQRARAACWILGFSLLGACGSNGTQELLAVQTQALTSSPPSMLPGYVHSLNRSRFRIGQGTFLEVNATTQQGWRGSLGAFAVDPTNGTAMGVLNADAPAEPYILDDTEQGAKVKAYFVGAGLPSDQIAAVVATYNGVSSGPVSAPLSSTPIRLQSINSVLQRGVNGIEIVESVAWAKMTTSGDVDAEYLFWPPINMTVVKGATALAATLADPVAHAAFLAKLPGVVYKDGGVVIHHSGPSVHSVPQAYMSYDVTLDPSTTAGMRHFDASGVEFRLPQELALTQ